MDLHEQRQHVESPRMNEPSAYEHLDPAQLVDVILTQADIVRLGADIAAVMTLVTDRALLLTSGDGAAVELLEGDDMVYRATSGIAWSQLGLRVKAASSLSDYCVRNGVIVNCPDVEFDDRVDLAACRRIGMRSMIVLPLNHEGVPVGVLKVMSKRANAFGSDEQLVLELLSELVASVMFHAGRQRDHGAPGGEVDMRMLVTRDLLTGLPNRALLYDLLRKRSAEAARHAEKFGVLRLSLEHYRSIHARQGRKGADAALIEAARRLQASARDGDTVARKGESEFAVILNRISTALELPVAIERFRQCLALPFEFEGQRHSLSALIGSALFPQDGAGLEALLEHASPQATIL